MKDQAVDELTNHLMDLQDKVNQLQDEISSQPSLSEEIEALKARLDESKLTVQQSESLTLHQEDSSTRMASKELEIDSLKISAVFQVNT